MEFTIRAISRRRCKLNDRDVKAIDIIIIITIAGKPVEM